MSKYEFVQRFLSASYLYFQLTEKTAADIPEQDLRELLEVINMDGDLMLCTDQIS